jgi:tripartite-type tricarboxylate transporter receptor subunit TctC
VWGQSVVIDNRPGATWVIAAQAVAHSAADGYTILVGTASTHAVLPALKQNVPYDNVKDFAPITLLGTTPYVLVVNPKLPATSLPGLTALLKTNPDKYSYASAGVGSLPHLAGELFKSMSGTSSASPSGGIARQSARKPS